MAGATLLLVKLKSGFVGEWLRVAPLARLRAGRGLTTGFELKRDGLAPSQGLRPCTPVGSGRGFGRGLIAVHMGVHVQHGGGGLLLGWI